jgi:hypothetical protein
MFYLSLWYWTNCFFFVWSPYSCLPYYINILSKNFVYFCDSLLPHAPYCSKYLYWVFLVFIRPSNFAHLNVIFEVTNESTLTVVFSDLRAFITNFMKTDQPIQNFKWKTNTSNLLFIRKEMKWSQTRKAVWYNVILRRVRVTFVAVGKQ